MDPATWQKLVEKHGKSKSHHQTGEKQVRGRQHTVNDDVKDSSPKKSGSRSRSKSPKSNVKKAGDSSPKKGENSLDKNLGSPRPHGQLRDKFTEALNKDTSHQIAKVYLKDNVKETSEDKLAELEKLDILRDAAEARQGELAQAKATRTKRQDQQKFQAKMAQKTFVQTAPKMGRHGNKNAGFPTGTDADFN
jgi:hypothetical protein